MITKLDLLKKDTIIVADTGDIELISKVKPQDATTNPSLILKVINQKYNHVNEAIVDIGSKIYNLVPGYVSTEVDASNSFDTQATVNQAREIIRLYKNKKVDTKRILIKIASTWQGIKAAEILEKEGIKCNLTLIFSLTQAIACAQANVTLISPFVGRVTDYYKENNIEYTEDPGVMLVKSIFEYFKKYNYKTIVMGASFRNIDQICSLAGCDRLTISPNLIEDLANSATVNKLDSKLEKQTVCNVVPPNISENKFYLDLAQDNLATTKLNQGILKFMEDTTTLKDKWITT